MGNGQSTIEEFNSYSVIRNIPFELIPQGFVEYLKDKVYDYQQFLQMCPFYNESGAYWNLLVYTKEGKPVAAVWGTWDPLEAHFRIVRVSFHPHWQRIGGSFAKWVITRVKEFASAMQADRLFFESNKSEAWLRKLDGLVYVDETKVISAY